MARTPNGTLHVGMTCEKEPGRQNGQSKANPGGEIFTERCALGLDSRLRDRVVSIYNIRVGATAIHQMPKGELVDCQIQPPAGEEKSARCLRRSEAVVCHTILVAAYPFS